MAMMVGTTIASMIAIESIRMVFSAAAIGPCGSRIFIGKSNPDFLLPVRVARNDDQSNRRFPCDAPGRSPPQIRLGCKRKCSFRSLRCWSIATLASFLDASLLWMTARAIPPKMDLSR